MEEDNNGRKSDMQVLVPMAPENCISAVGPISFTISDSHLEACTKGYCLIAVDKDDGSNKNAKVRNGVAVSQRPLEELPSGALDNGQIDAVITQKADHGLDGCEGGHQDTMDVTEEPDQSSTPQEDHNLGNRGLSNPKNNGSQVEDSSAVSMDSLDDLQPLCKLGKRGKSGEHGLMALAGRSSYPDGKVSPEDLLRSLSKSSDGDQPKPDPSCSKLEPEDGVPGKASQGEGVVAITALLKSRPSNGLERSGRKGSAEGRRASRQVKKRRYVWRKGREKSIGVSRRVLGLSMWP